MEEKNSGNNQEVAELDEENDISLQEEAVETEEIQVEENIEEENIEEEKSIQTKEDNKAARFARIRAEQEAQKKIEEAYQKGLKEATSKQYVGKTNPYTGRPITDDIDVQEFLTMQEIAEKGGDPILDYTLQFKEKEKQEIIKQNKVKEEMIKMEQINAEINEFIEAHPNLDVNQLLNDPNFILFADGKVGNKPLSTIYDDYNKVISHYQKDAAKKAKNIIANSMSTPGSLSGGKQENIDYDQMSSEEFEKIKKKVLDSRY